MSLRERLSNILFNLESATDSEDEKAAWDAALDLLETLIDMTPTKIDNIFLKPIIGIIRRRYDIPDND